MDATAPIPDLTVVVPVYNEEANLPACLRTLSGTLAGSSHENLIVDDGSADGTLAIARQLAAERPETVRVLTHERNRGFGAALRTGFAEAQGKYVTSCPADFEMTPEDWQPFAEAMGSADVLVGCRHRREGYNPLMRLNSWVYPKLVRLLFSLRLRDVNWISVYRRELMREVSITQTGIPMMVEILVKLRDQGATFREVDCRMQPRRVGKASAAPSESWCARSRDCSNFGGRIDRRKCTGPMLPLRRTRPCPEAIRMSIPLVDLQAQYRTIRPEVDAALACVLERGDFILGQAVAEFEEAFAGFVGVRHCVGVASGTDAIFLSLRIGDRPRRPGFVAGEHLHCDGLGGQLRRSNAGPGRCGPGQFHAGCRGGPAVAAGWFESHPSRPSVRPVG